MEELNFCLLVLACSIRCDWCELLPILPLPGR